MKQKGRGSRGGGKKGAAPAPFLWRAGRQHSPFVAMRAGPPEREKGREGGDAGGEEKTAEERAAHPMPTVRGRAERAAAKSASLRRDPAMCRTCAKICVILASSCPSGGGRGARARFREEMRGRPRLILTPRFEPSGPVVSFWKKQMTECQ